ncbi:unnamed protein product [Penicillium camemberti]|uniref:Str. FM013 n=1 Tax=Penicillium camemberti (strain FM 013) TaxID=1429867 RepID=A0A0G4PV83_PENC3|nr:unnamed protein product [Penicillium camemberti]
MSQHHIIRDDSSSVYSRPIDSPKVSLTSRAASTLPAKHELPEINSLDHQIAMARGSTMALETTRVRLQSSKSEHRRSLPELRSEKLRQLGQQKMIEAIQDLTPQSYFEPDATSVRNLNILQAIRHLRERLEKSRVQEARAEQNWKSQWDPCRIWDPTSRWI